MKRICKNCLEFDAFDRKVEIINGRVKKTCGATGDMYDEYCPCQHDRHFKERKNEQIQDK
jgi:hypothetical protein